MENKEIVLVTGADGMLGASICRNLLANGYTVVAFVLPDSRTVRVLDGLDIQIKRGNILDASAVQEALKGCDYVINAAALTTVWPRSSAIVTKVNCEGALHVAHAVKALGLKRMVQIGTASSFGAGSKNNPGSERSGYEGARWDMDYITSKYDAQVALQNLHKEQNLPVVIVNPTFMIGPFDSGPSSGKMVMEFYKGKVPAYSGGGKNFVASKDVATAAVNALKLGREGECYIAGNENLTYKEFFDKIKNVANKKFIMFPVPNFIVLAMGFVQSGFARTFKRKPQLSFTMAKMALQDQYYNVSKAREELKLPQTPIETAISDCIGWYKEVGYLE